jgi:hypothetical protein
VCVLPAKHGFVRQRAVKRDWSSDSSPSRDGCLPCAEYAHIYRRYVVAAQSDTSHMKPLVATLTLHHWLAVVHAVAHTSRAFTRETASICRWSVQTVGMRRGIE